MLHQSDVFARIMPDEIEQPKHATQPHYIEDRQRNLPHGCIPFFPCLRAFDNHKAGTGGPPGCTEDVLIEAGHDVHKVPATEDRAGPAYAYIADGSWEAGHDTRRLITATATHAH